MVIAPRVVVGVPSGIAQEEKRVVKASAAHAGAREVYLIEQPMASAIGVGLPVHEPAGNMIVDIGGGAWEIVNITLARGGFCRTRPGGGGAIVGTGPAPLQQGVERAVRERQAGGRKVA